MKRNRPFLYGFGHDGTRDDYLIVVVSRNLEVALNCDCNNSCVTSSAMINVEKCECCEVKTLQLWNQSQYDM